MDFFNRLLHRNTSGGAAQSSQTSNLKHLPGKAVEPPAQNKIETRFPTKAGSDVTSPVQDHIGCHLSEPKTGRNKIFKFSLRENDTFQSFDREEEEEEERFEDAEENKLSLQGLAKDLENNQSHTADQINDVDINYRHPVDPRDQSSNCSAYEDCDIPLNVSDPSYTSNFSHINNKSICLSEEKTLDNAESRALVVEGLTVENFLKNNEKSNPITAISRSADVTSEFRLTRDENKSPQTSYISSFIIPEENINESFSSLATELVSNETVTEIPESQGNPTEVFITNENKEMVQLTATESNSNLEIAEESTYKEVTKIQDLVLGSCTSIPPEIGLVDLKHDFSTTDNDLTLDFTAMPSDATKLDFMMIPVDSQQCAQNVELLDSHFENVGCLLNYSDVAEKTSSKFDKNDVDVACLNSQILSSDKLDEQFENVKSIELITKELKAQRETSHIFKDKDSANEISNLYQNLLVEKSLSVENNCETGVPATFSNVESDSMLISSDSLDSEKDFEVPVPQHTGETVDDRPNRCLSTSNIKIEEDTVLSIADQVNDVNKIKQIRCETEIHQNVNDCEKLDCKKEEISEEIVLSGERDHFKSTYTVEDIRKNENNKGASISNQTETEIMTQIAVSNEVVASSKNIIQRISPDRSIAFAFGLCEDKKKEPQNTYIKTVSFLSKKAPSELLETKLSNKSAETESLVNLPNAEEEIEVKSADDLQTSDTELKCSLIVPEGSNTQSGGLFTVSDIKEDLVPNCVGNISSEKKTNSPLLDMSRVSSFSQSGMLNTLDNLESPPQMNIEIIPETLDRFKKPANNVEDVLPINEASNEKHDLADFVALNTGTVEPSPSKTSTPCNSKISAKIVVSNLEQFIEVNEMELSSNKIEVQQIGNQNEEIKENKLEIDSLKTNEEHNDITIASQIATEEHDIFENKEEAKLLNEDETIKNDAFYKECVNDGSATVPRKTYDSGSNKKEETEISNPHVSFLSTKTSLEELENRLYLESAQTERLVEQYLNKSVTLDVENKKVQTVSDVQQAISDLQSICENLPSKCEQNRFSIVPDENHLLLGHESKALNKDSNFKEALVSNLTKNLSSALGTSSDSFVNSEVSDFSRLEDMSGSSSDFFNPSEKQRNKQVQESSLSTENTFYPQTNTKKELANEIFDNERTKGKHETETPLPAINKASDLKGFCTQSVSKDLHVDKCSPKRDPITDFKAVNIKYYQRPKTNTICKFHVSSNEKNENVSSLEFDDRLTEEAACISNHILSVSQEIKDSDSDSDYNRTVLTKEDRRNKIESVPSVSCRSRKSPSPKKSSSFNSSPLKVLKDIQNICESNQFVCLNSASIESYIQSMHSVAHLNQSEAGPITADEVSTKDLEFQDGATLDLDFFTRVTDSEATSKNRLSRESLYVKFDPIISKLGSDSDSLKMQTESDKKCEERGDASKTPGRSPALEVIPKLISQTTATAKVSPVKPESGSVGAPSTRSPLISQEQLKKELKKLEDLMKEREIYFENELGKKQAELESREVDASAGSARRAELEAELKAATEREHRLEKEVVERTKSKQQLSLVMEEYEKTISQLVAQKEEEKKDFEVQKDLLMKERDRAMQHLNNMEIAFNDVHQKYERSKTVIEGMKANEDELKKSLKEYNDAVKSSSAKYDSLKNHAIQQLEKANQELDLIRRSHQAEIAKLQAMLKKAEVRVTSLEESLEQKSKENQELAAICDELINKVGSGGN